MSTIAIIITGMKAIRVHEFGEPEVMQLEDVQDGAPLSHHAVMESSAYGKIVLIP